VDLLHSHTLFLHDALPIWLSNIKLFMALGATIDFEAGTLKRAPVWMQKMSLEWAYRMFKEPKRLWKRYMIDDLPFLGLILKEKRSEEHTSELQSRENIVCR